MVLKGVIRGKTIELEREPGLPDGQAVTVTVQPAGARSTSPTTPEALAALSRAAGGWSDDPEGLDRYLESVREARKRDERGLAE